MHVGTIQAGRDYEVELRVAPTTAEPVAFAIFFSAPAGVAVPNPEIGIVAPGGTVRKTGTAAQGALRLVIDVDLADSGGAFDLRLTEVGGTTRSKSGIEADTRWTAIIV